MRSGGPDPGRFGEHATDERPNARWGRVTERTPPFNAFSGQGIDFGDPHPIPSTLGQTRAPLAMRRANARITGGPGWFRCSPANSGQADCGFVGLGLRRFLSIDNLNLRLPVRLIDAFFQIQRKSQTIQGFRRRVADFHAGLVRQSDPLQAQSFICLAIRPPCKDADDHHGVAEEGARQCNPLALAARKRRAAEDLEPFRLLERTLRDSAVGRGAAPAG